MSTDLKIRFASLLKYVQQMDEHLAGKRGQSPQVSLLEWDEVVAQGAICSATSGEDQYGPYIAAIVYNERSPRSPRLFDPAYFAAFGLAELSLLTLKWHHMSQKNRLYILLMLCAPGESADEGVTASRLILGTDAGTEAEFMRGQRDLRRDALAAQERRRPHPSRSGRDDVFARAQEAYEIGNVQELLDISAKEFRTHLENAVQLADAVFLRSDGNNGRFK